MKAPLSWIAEYAALPAGLSGRDLGEALVGAGLEVENVEALGGDISGPVVIGRVVDFVDEAQKNGRTIRWCHVDVGAALAPDAAPQPLPPADSTEPLPGGYWPRGIVCGALNFAAGDHVVVALPGSVLPGGFELGSRRTYGHVSDGMICATDELGLGGDHSGIWVLGDDNAGQPWVPGQDALAALRVRDEVLDMPVTPDMGYCLSIRGLAREAAQALGVGFTDPLQLETPAGTLEGYPVRLDDDGCPLFVALTVEGFDPQAPTPAWMATRLAASGMRSISLHVDVSNYVMLESGQPNHCYDADALRGPIVVRRAQPGERLVTLDDVDRALDPEDLVIADDRGAIGLAGVMGGASTELRDTTTRIVIEAAHFDPIVIARTARRHRLGSEASRRFERTVDPAAAYPAAHRVAALLVELGGGRLLPGVTVAGLVPQPPTRVIRATLPAEVLGMDVPPARAVEVLRAGGVHVVEDGTDLRLTPPTWRPDLRDPYDYVEEVGTKVGLEHLPSVVPTAPVGRGLTLGQALRRTLNRALATAGFVEVLTFPWASDADADALGLPADDPRRRAARLANPLADTAPLLRTTMLPGLFGAVQRNTSRGNDDLALYEAGRVFFRASGGPAPLPGVTSRPTDADLASIEAALPVQPRHLAAVIAGDWRPAGWQGDAERASWRHAIAFAEVAADAVGVRLSRASASEAPWHPGRCAALSVGDRLVGHAGELHPSVCRAFGLPARTAAVELDLDLLVSLHPGAGTVVPVSGHPVAKEDVALVVDEAVSVGELQAVVAEGAGALLESIRLFDVYRGAPVPPGRKSVAFALRFRASDRTLTAEEVAGARGAGVAAAERRFGAELRG